MPVSNEKKEFCAHNLVAMIMQDIKEYFSDVDDIELIARFTSSKTYTQLFRLETGLWAEGPDYILNMYFEEIGFVPN